MKRWLVVVGLALSAGCSNGGSSAAPTAPTATKVTAAPAGTTYTLSGTLTAINGGQPISGATVTVGAATSTTDAAGAFALTSPATLGSEVRMAVSGTALVDRSLFVMPTSHAAAVDAIDQDGTFSLDFYRELVRNNLEEPGVLHAVQHWTTSPHFFIPTVDDAGKAMDRTTLDTVASTLMNAVTAWTAGRYAASVEFVSAAPSALAPGQASVAWQTTGDAQTCGTAEVGGSHVWFHYTNKLCACSTSAVAPSTVMHEVGHLMGFWHTDDKGDEMYYAMTSCMKDLSSRERYHSAIAFARPNGNQDADADPGSRPAARRGPPVILR
jgi:hypothetical protein